MIEQSTDILQYIRARGDAQTVGQKTEEPVQILDAGLSNTSGQNRKCHVTGNIPSYLPHLMQATTESSLKVILCSIHALLAI